MRRSYDVSRWAGVVRVTGRSIRTLMNMDCRVFVITWPRASGHGGCGLDCYAYATQSSSSQLDENDVASPFLAAITERSNE